MPKARIQREKQQHTGFLQANDNIGKIHPIRRVDQTEGAMQVDDSLLV